MRSAKQNGYLKPPQNLTVLDETSQACSKYNKVHFEFDTCMLKRSEREITSDEVGKSIILVLFRSFLASVVNKDISYKLKTLVFNRSFGIQKNQGSSKL